MVFLVSCGMIGSIYGQIEPSIDENSTVTYPASFFDQYQPYSVNDMLIRIPGINSALGGQGSRGGNRRGLGAVGTKF